MTTLLEKVDLDQETLEKLDRTTKLILQNISDIKKDIKRDILGCHDDAKKKKARGI